MNVDVSQGPKIHLCNFKFVIAFSEEDEQSQSILSSPFSSLALS